MDTDRGSAEEDGCLEQRVEGNIRWLHSPQERTSEQGFKWHTRFLQVEKRGRTFRAVGLPMLQKIKVPVPTRIQPLSGYSSCDQSSRCTWVEWQMMEGLSKKPYSYGKEFEFLSLFQKLVEIHLRPTQCIS